MQAQISEQPMVEFDQDIPQVESTTNYKQFKFIKGNRLVSSRHIGHLISSITRKNLLAAYPLVVNEDMEIIDGQHRLAAAKALGLPVYFVIIPDLGLTDVQYLNTYTKPWTMKDYLASFCLINKRYYLAFREFINDFELTIEQAFILILGDSDGQIYQTFREGDLSFTDEQLAQARKKGEFMSDLRIYFIDRGFTSNYWPRAVNYVFGKDKDEEILSKLDQAKPRLTRSHSRKDYLRQLEDILNWRKSKDLDRLI